MKLLSLLTLLPLSVTALWPIPSDYRSGNQTVWIDRSVQINGHNGTQVGIAGLLRSPFALQAEADLQGTTTNYPVTSQISQRRIQYAIRRTYRTIFEQTFVPWKFHPRNSDFEPGTTDKTFITSVTLQQTGVDPPDTATPLDGSVDESYTLSLSTSGEVVIKANTSIGLVYGLTTFSQLFFKHSQGGSYTNLAPVEIKDAPKFVHRGLNMDVSRNYFAVDDIKRTLDAMALTKMNRFHLHVTDAQSWPLVIPSLPELSEQGAYSKDLIYTPSDLEDIQGYAQILGIEAYLEIDMPGHTSSIWFSHPELIAAFNVQPDWSTYCAEPPCGTLKLNSTAVDSFLDTLLSDLLPRVKPYSSYFHSGGDEVNVNSYLLDDTVNSNSTSVLQPLMQRFVDANHERIRNQSLTPVVWEEMLLHWNLTLDPSTVVQTWQSDEAVAQSVAQGYRTLAGNYNYWYLDCGQGQWINFHPNASASFWPYADYCTPRKNWRLVYSYNPLSGVPANQTHLVLGGECHVWTEQTDPVSLDRTLWPRAAAAAEVLWSGAIDPATGQNRSQIDAAPRLSDFRDRLVSRGVMAEPIQMPFCTMNGTQCAL